MRWCVRVLAGAVVEERPWQQVENASGYAAELRKQAGTKTPSQRDAARL